MCEIHRAEDVESTKKGISEFIDELVVATTNARIYSHDHPRVSSSIETLVSSLGEQIDRSESHQLFIGAAEGFLFHDQRALLGASLSAAKIIDALEEVGAGGLSFDRNTDADEFLALIQILGMNRRDHASFDDANRDLKGRGCRHIRFLPPYRGPGVLQDPTVDLIPRSGLGGVASSNIELNIPVELYQRTVSLLQDSMVRACHRESLSIDETRGHVEAILDRLTIDATSMMSISRYERYDAYTFGHSIRVCFLTLNFAKALFDDQAMLLRLGTAALLHDIGKAWVPFEVLYSKTRLTPEERVEMDKHATHGAQILLDLKEPDPMSVATAFAHHRTLDGAGYPDTLHDLRPSIATRIVKICDVYEALTAVRPYKPRMSPVRAYRIMMSMDKHFDTALLRRFIQVNGAYPVGSKVQISTGETGQVVAQTEDLRRPVVLLEDGASPNSEMRRRDLSENRDPAGPRVEHLLEAA